uniref:Secreted protein n=1 Tax=Knipowitschia caucasica TaxID=637954 RepID=A0AAV2JFN2_KNICA
MQSLQVLCGTVVIGCVRNKATLVGPCCEFNLLHEAAVAAIKLLNHVLYAQPCHLPTIQATRSSVCSGFPYC